MMAEINNVFTLMIVRTMLCILLTLHTPSSHSFIQTQFDISVASELMAILALTTSLRDMKERIGNTCNLYSIRGLN